MNNWWISNCKAFDRDTTRWYCSLCGCRHEIEVNPLWERDGRPLRGEGKYPYLWLTRCDKCGKEHWYSVYDCPFCGRPQDDDQVPLKIENYQTDIQASYEYGIEGHSWDAKYRCKTCGRIYWIDNGDW